MQDFVKLCDLGIDIHLTEITSLKNPDLRHSFSSEDIIKRISSVSIDLPEREFELGATNPLLPSHFDFKKIRLKNQSFSRTSISLSENVQKQKIQNLSPKAVLKDLKPTHSEDLLEKISSDLQNISTLAGIHAYVQQLNTGLECQKFATHCLTYQDMAQVDYLWLADAPSSEDDRSGHIFCDPPAQMIMNLLKLLKIDRSEGSKFQKIGFLNLSFWPLTFDNASDLDHPAYMICWPFIKKMLSLIKPKKIICAGHLPFAYLQKMGLVSLSNDLQTQDFSVIKIDDTPTSCYKTVSIDYILRSDVGKKIFWFDFLKMITHNK